MNKIPSIGLGTYRLRGEIAYKMVLSALQMGYIHIDTAALYRNEEFVGKAINESNIQRDNIFITTKIKKTDLDSNEKMIESIQSSLIKLQTNYIDLVLLHAPPNDLNRIKDAWKLMEDIVNGNIIKLKNKVKHIGISNFNADHIEILIKNCKIVPMCNQIEVTPYLNQSRTIKICNKYKIKIVAHSSLVKGEKFNDDKLLELSKQTLHSPPQLLIGWAINKNFIVLPRTSNSEHLIENFNSSNIKLSNDVVECLDTFDEQYATHPQYLNNI